MIDPDEVHAAAHGLGAVGARDHDDRPIVVPGPSTEALDLVRRASPARLAVRIGVAALIVAAIAAGAFRASAWWADKKARSAEAAHFATGDTPAFDLDRAEVTVGDYATCVARRRCAPPPRGEGCNGLLDRVEGEAITCIAHEQAAAYCAWVKRRLPTEREIGRALREGIIEPPLLGFRCAR